ncbi:MAG: cysteine methyltransferase [Deltaproteobacteria bacterium]|nr:MAG: cysteine methyltransferase [Deltaproteobacteria bacterium]
MDEPRAVTPGFWGRVYDKVREVPHGKVVTYGQVAAALGSVRAARQVGFALAGLRVRPEDSDVPWHRVINAKGMISHRGDLLRPTEQQELLEAEGVTFDANGKVDLKRYRYAFEV